MADITKPISAEISVTTANTVFNAKLVRIYAANDALVTVSAANATVIGSFTMPAGDIELVEKNTSDTISANVAVKCCSIGYK